MAYLDKISDVNSERLCQNDIVLDDRMPLLASPAFPHVSANHKSGFKFQTVATILIGNFDICFY